MFCKSNIYLKSNVYFFALVDFIEHKSNMTDYKDAAS